MSMDPNLLALLQQTQQTQNNLAHVYELQQRQLEKLTALVKEQKSASAAGTQMEATQLEVRIPDEQMMNALGKRVPKFRYDPKNGLTFESWFARFLQLCLMDAEHLDDKKQTRMLLSRLEQTEYDRYAMSILPDTPDQRDLKQTTTVLTQKFGRTESVFGLRFKCLSLEISPAWDDDQWSDIVNKACEEFKHDDFSKEDLKALMYIVGMKAPEEAEKRLRLLKLLEESTPTKAVRLGDLVAETKRMRLLKRDSAIVGGQKQSSSVLTVKEEAKRPERKASRSSAPCYLCGELHYARDCPHKDEKCTKCGVIGHRTGYCGSAARYYGRSAGGQRKEQGPLTKVVQATGIVGRLDYLPSEVTMRRRFVTVRVNGVRITLQFATAADLTIISEENWHMLGSPSEGNQVGGVKSASLEEIPIIATFAADIELHERRKTGTVYVSSISTLNVFGLDWMERFDMWSARLDQICDPVEKSEAGGGVLKIEREVQQQVVAQLVEKFAHVFDTTPGQWRGEKVKVHLKPGVCPVRLPARHVSLKARELIEPELKRLQDAGVLTPVTHSQWSAPIVPVHRADGRVRITADYSTGLNEAVQENHHPVPQPEDIFASLAGKRVFSKVDLSDAYLQIPVDDETSELQTIATHLGLYKVNRLQPGVRSAPGIFQSITDNAFADFPDVWPFFDDFLVASEDVPAHIELLEKVFERMSEVGFKVKLSKCELMYEDTKYLGYLLGAEGIRPDPAKTTAIATMPPPRNVSELRSYLGAITFYARFWPDMHLLRSPMDNLLKKDVKWDWTDECQNSFEKFKDLLISDTILMAFDPRLPIKVAADASNVGLGAVLSHQMPDGAEKVISYAARALLPAEKNYAQVEKEALALVWACEKFHRYLFGRKFVLETDHRPLLSIFGSKTGKPKHTISRLQRWANRLALYDFEIRYIPSGEFGNADVLSRLIADHKMYDEETVISVARFEGDVAKLPVTFEQIEMANRSDRTLQKVMTYVREGWPKRERNVTADPVVPYFQMKESLSLVKECLFFGNCIVIPTVLRSTVLDELHATHPGPDAMKALAREYVFWPKINEDIQNKSLVCSSCQEAANVPRKSILKSWPDTAEPMERIHVDFAHWKGKVYLVIVEVYSRYPHVYACAKETSATTVEKLSDFFGLFGNADAVVMDNGPAFDSDEFERFCTSRGIRHLRSPPYHPQSNGRAERFVQTFKKALEKIGDERGVEQALSDFLQRYRATPHRLNPKRKSPAELFLRRKIATQISLVEPPKPPSTTRNVEQERQYDRRHGAIDRPFEGGEEVYVQVHKRNKWFWAEGEIIERKGDVTYVVFLPETGRLLFSHSNKMRHRHAKSLTPMSNGLPVDILLGEFGLLEDTGDGPQPSADEESQPDGSPIMEPIGPMGPENGPAPVPSQPTPAPNRRNPVRQRHPPAYLKDYLRY